MAAAAVARPVRGMGERMRFHQGVFAGSRRMARRVSSRKRGLGVVWVP